MKKKSIAIIGPAYPLRGGLASFNERLAREFTQQGFDVTIYTFSLQYPGFLFPGTTQFSTDAAPQDLNIKVAINSVNPFNWLRIGHQLKNKNYDIIIVRFWLPFMGPALGTILRRAKSNKHTKIICIADNIIPHEKRFGDKPFTKYFIKPIDAFVTMSAKVLADLKTFTNKPSKQIVHPLYDNFGEAMPKAEARKYLGIAEDENIILFFGFIRHYKGLDILLEAMELLNSTFKIKNLKSPKLLIAGEFYEEKTKYDELINKVKDNLILRTDFIADSEVKYYLSAADFVIQPYRNATQSGVTPLAYHFDKPMLVTNVGGLPDLVPEDRVGLIAEPNATSIAEKIIELYAKGDAHFIPYIKEEKMKYSWQKLADTILQLASGV